MRVIGKLSTRELRRRMRRAGVEGTVKVLNRFGIEVEEEGEGEESPTKSQCVERSDTKS